MKIQKIILFSILIISLMISCDNEEFTGDSLVNFKSPTATFAITGDTNDIIVNEKDIDSEDGQVFTIEATLSEAVQFDTFIDLTVTEGTTDNADYTIKRIFVPALMTKGTGSITINRTGDMEGDETLTVTANTNSPNVKGSETFNFTIQEDYLNDNLIMNIEWCSDYEFDFDSGTLAGNYGEKIDLDIYLLDENTGDTVATAATGDCPEHLELGGLPDGSYIVVVYVWDNKLSSLGLGENVPLNISYEQEYFIGKTEFPHNLILSTDSPGDTNSAGIPIGPLARIVKVGHEFTVTTP